MAKKMRTVVVTVDDAHFEKMSEVVSSCEAAGLKVTEVLDILGQITGAIDSEHETTLNKIDGVMSVDRSQQIELPPSDSDLQ